jgi:hypothetical protein
LARNGVVLDAALNKFEGVTAVDYTMLVGIGEFDLELDLSSA